MQDLVGAQRQLEALPGERECRQEEERLTAEIQGLEKACQYRDVDMRATLEKQKKTDDEVCISICYAFVTLCRANGCNLVQENQIVGPACT